VVLVALNDGEFRIKPRNDIALLPPFLPTRFIVGGTDERNETGGGPRLPRGQG
jgi:hypothetical protein